MCKRLVLFYLSQTPSHDLLFLAIFIVTKLTTSYREVRALPSLICLLLPNKVAGPYHTFDCFKVFSRKFCDIKVPWISSTKTGCSWRVDMKTAKSWKIFSGAEFDLSLNTNYLGVLVSLIFSARFYENRKKKTRTDGKEAKFGSMTGLVRCLLWTFRDFGGVYTKTVLLSVFKGISD